MLLMDKNNQKKRHSREKNSRSLIGNENLEGETENGDKVEVNGDFQVDLVTDQQEIQQKQQQQQEQENSQKGSTQKSQQYKLNAKEQDNKKRKKTNSKSKTNKNGQNSNKSEQSNENQQNNDDDDYNENLNQNQDENDNDNDENDNQNEQKLEKKKINNHKEVEQLLKKEIEHYTKDIENEDNSDNEDDDDDDYEHNEIQKKQQKQDEKEAQQNSIEKKNKNEEDLDQEYESDDSDFEDEEEQEQTNEGNEQNSKNNDNNNNFNENEDDEDDDEDEEDYQPVGRSRINSKPNHDLDEDENQDQNEQQQQEQDDKDRLEYYNKLSQQTLKVICNNNEVLYDGSQTYDEYDNDLYQNDKNNDNDNEQLEYFEEGLSEQQKKDLRIKYYKEKLQNQNKNQILQFYSLPKKIQDINIRDYLEIPGHGILEFGRVYPGQNQEKEIEIYNISSDNIVVNIQIEQNNPVYVLNTQQQQYNNTNIQNNTNNNNNDEINNSQIRQNQNIQVLIAANSSTSFKVELQLNSDSKEVQEIIKKPCDLSSRISFQLEGFAPIKKEEEEEKKKNDDDYDKKEQKKQDQEQEGKKKEEEEVNQREIFVDIYTNLAIPKVFCPKSMYYKGMNVIKAHCKLSFPQTEIAVRFQMKDYSNIVNLEFLDDQPNDYLTIRPKPAQTYVDYGGFFLTSFVMRPNYLNIKKDKIKKVSKVLLLKLKNTAVILSFPVIIEIC